MSEQKAFIVALVFGDSVDNAQMFMTAHNAPFVGGATAYATYQCLTEFGAKGNLLMLQAIELTPEWLRTALDLVEGKERGAVLSLVQKDEGETAEAVPSAAERMWNIWNPPETPSNGAA
jgi:hypothetical protein